MRAQSLPLDPFSLTRIGAAIWMTNLIVAREIAQALVEQNTLITRATRGRAFTQCFRIDRKLSSRAGFERYRAGTVPPTAQLKRVLVCGENGSREILLATPLAGVPIEAALPAGSDVIPGRNRVGFVFHRSGHDRR
jgi:hypothetical protein